jgi:hypothetical protein
MPTAGPSRALGMRLLIYVLLGAAVVSAALGHPVDAAVILGVVLVNASSASSRKARPSRRWRRSAAMLAPHASVMRDGRRMDRRREALVPGDVVLLEAGDRVPADLRLLSRPRPARRGSDADRRVRAGPTSRTDAVPTPAAPLGDRHCLLPSPARWWWPARRGRRRGDRRATEIGRSAPCSPTRRDAGDAAAAQMNRFARQLTGSSSGLAAGRLRLRRSPGLDGGRGLHGGGRPRRRGDPRGPAGGA